MKTAGRIRSAVTTVTAGGYLYMVLAVAAAACLLDPTGPAEVPGIVMLGGLAVVAAVGLYWYLTGRMTAGRLITLLIAAGFVLRLGYTLYTGAQQRQHDVEQFGGGVGHAGYIEYLYEHFSLPPGDPTATWQFYHPPLHHWLAACCMRLITACGGSYQRAVESIQYLTLLYSGFCMLLCRRLFELLGLRGRGAVAAMGVVCFYPAFILLAGSVNNDILSVTLMLAALVTALQWWQEPTLPRILAVAGAGGAAAAADGAVRRVCRRLFSARAVVERAQPDRLAGVSGVRAHAVAGQLAVYRRLFGLAAVVRVDRLPDEDRVHQLRAETGLSGLQSDHRLAENRDVRGI